MLDLTNTANSPELGAKPQALLWKSLLVDGC